MEKTSVKVVANSIAKVRRTAGAPTMDANAGAGVPWEAPEAAEIQQWEAAAAAPRASSAPMPAAGGAASTREEQWMDLFENLDRECWLCCTGLSGVGWLLVGLLG